MRAYCPLNEITPEIHLYFGYGIILCTLVLSQIALIINAFIHRKALKSIPKRISYLYMMLLLVALTLGITDLCTKTIFVQIYPNFIFNTPLCNFTTYWDKIAVPLYQFISLSQLLIRLETTFKNSTYALSQKTRIVIWSCLIVPYIFIAIGWFGFFQDICWRSWSPPDLNTNKHLFVCAALHSPITDISAYVFFSFSIIANIFLGAIFTLKLKNLIKETANKMASVKVKDAMVRNTILTVSIVCSTLICWTCMILFGWYLGGLAHVDIMINCLCFSLMFEFNAYFYKKVFCRLCNYCFVQSHQGLELMNVTSFSSRSMSSASQQASNEAKESNSTTKPQSSV
eukprot:224599_1